MILADQVIDLLPGLLQGRLASDPFFADIPVLISEKGNIALTAAVKKSVMTVTGGKCGVAVIVLQMVADDEYPNLATPGGPMTLKPSFQVIEQAELNHGPNGTGKSARRVSRKVIELIKCLGFPGIATRFMPAAPAIEPIPMDPSLGANLVAYQVNFECLEAYEENLQQAAMPIPALDGQGNFYFTCATPGVAVYYTTDDSFPGPSNPAAIPYPGPVAIPAAGLTIMAIAYLPGMIASRCTRAVIERQAVISD